MIITALLTIIFTLMAVICFVFVRARGARRLLLLIYILAIFFVLNPNSSTRLANIVGVGRGIDLVLVLLVIALTNGLIIYIRHLYNMQRNITQLARHIAKREAYKPEHGE